MSFLFGAISLFFLISLLVDITNKIVFSTAQVNAVPTLWLIQLFVACIFAIFAVGYKKNV